MTKSSNGYFVISLDFELCWGVFDSKKESEYGSNIRNVYQVIPRLIELCEKYEVQLTFATVGLLFSKTKDQLIKNNPKVTPTYTETKYNPYPLISTIGLSEDKDHLHYAYSLIKLIKDTNQHEISTHTYSHYYCLEKGQTQEQFQADIDAAIRAANAMGISITSIVFPRNQVNSEYLKICADNGITSYRGNESSFFKSAKSKKDNQNPIFRMLRLIDTYFNISGNHTYKVKELHKKDGIINLPSSRFLRPYSKSLNFLEKYKIRRIKKAMSHAASGNEVFHLWWHPHNFGSHIDENFSQLETIFKHYEKLKTKHNFKTITMSELAKTAINTSS